MKKLITIVIVSTILFNLSIEAKKNTNRSQERSQRIVAEITHANQTIVQRYEKALAWIACDDDAKRDNEIKRIVLKTTQEWKSDSWYGTLTQFFEGTNVYESQPFLQYKKALDNDIYALEQNLKKLKSRSGEYDCDGISNEVEILLHDLKELRALICAHDRYVQERDKLELKSQLLSIVNAKK